MNVFEEENIQEDKLHFSRVLRIEFRTYSHTHTHFHIYPHTHILTWTYFIYS